MSGLRGVREGLWEPVDCATGRSISVRFIHPDGHLLGNKKLDNISQNNFAKFAADLRKYWLKKSVQFSLHCFANDDS